MSYGVENEHETTELALTDDIKRPARVLKLHAVPDNEQDNREDDSGVTFDILYKGTGLIPLLHQFLLKDHSDCAKDFAEGDGGESDSSFVLFVVFLFSTSRLLDVDDGEETDKGEEDT